MLLRKLLLLVFMFITLISCGEKKETTPTIKFWHFWSEPYQRTALRIIIDEFEKETGIKVETTELSWNDGKTKLMAAFNSATAPDVLELGSDWVAQFSSSDVLFNIPKSLSGIEKYIPFSTEPCYWNNNIYALPWFVDTRVLFINDSILSENGFGHPNTWEEVLDQCKVINGKNDKYGFGVNGPDKNRLYKKAISFMWSAGGELLNGKDVNLNSPENKYAIELYTQLSKFGLIEKQRNLDEIFINGDLAFTISGGWLLEKLKKENPDLKFSVIPIPGMNGKEGVSFAGGEYLSINAASKKNEEALKFIKYMTDGKNTIKFCKEIIEAGFPADKRFYRDPYYQSQVNRMVFAEQLNSAKMTPVTPYWFEIQDLLERAFEEALYEEDTIDNILLNGQQKLEDLVKD